MYQRQVSFDKVGGSAPFTKKKKWLAFKWKDLIINWANKDVQNY